MCVSHLLCLHADWQLVSDVDADSVVRQSPAGLYAVAPFAAAQGLIEIPYIVVQCVSYW